MNLPTQNFSLIVADFIALFFPNYCSACSLTLSKSERLVCSHCLADLQLTNLHLDQPNRLHQIFFDIPQLKYAMSYTWFRKGTVIQKLLHQLKYERNERIGVLLGELYGQALSQNYSDKWDLITSVPIHFRKEKIRGYNQSDKIAQGLSSQLNIPFEAIIKKCKYGASQTKKHRTERFKNVEDTFQLIIKPERLKNKRVLLVDDVITTGATLQACSQVVQKAGAEVSVATISCTQ